MTRRSPALFAQDIIEAIDALKRWRAAHRPIGDDENLQRIWAEERGLSIISEACRHLPADWKAQHSHIPWRQIEDFGNVIRHAYFGIDPVRIDLVIDRHLDPLAEVVRTLLPPPSAD